MSLGQFSRPESHCRMGVQGQGQQFPEWAGVSVGKFGFTLQEVIKISSGLGRMLLSLSR